MQNARVLFTAIGLPVLGWLLMATIWNHFQDRYGPDDPVRQRYYVAERCDERGPVTVRGFGFWWECTGRDESGREFEENFLTPADIGKKVPVQTWKSSKSSSIHRSAQQLVGGWSFLALPFGAAWIWLIGRAMKWTDRHEPDSPEKTSRSRQVRIGRPLGLDWWRPMTLSREGITWIGHFLRWREIREVRLVGGTLHVRPLVGEWVTIGPFTGERVEVVYQALELFARNRYRDQRDGDQQPPRSTRLRSVPPQGPPAKVAPPRQMAPRPVLGGPDVVLRGGPHPTFLLWPNRIMFVVAGTAMAVQSPEPVITIVFAVLVVLVIVDGARRWNACPVLTIGEGGVRWKGHEFGWREIADVRLVRNTLRIQSCAGDVVELGRFAPSQAARVEAGLIAFGGDRHQVTSVK